jgi:uncharacterized protein
MRCRMEDGRVGTTIVVRPLASALPLGFFAFGIGMLLLGASGLGWAPASEGKQVGMLLMAFVFPLEFAAMIIAFLARDTGGATALGVFSTSWLAAGWLLLEANPGQTSDAFGLYELTFATMVLLLAVAAWPAKPFFTVLLSVSAVRAVLAGAYELGGSTTVDRIAGGFGVGICVVAFYGGLALLLEDAQQRAVLPLFRRGDAARALEGDLGEQLQRLENEAGIRTQL